MGCTEKTFFPLFGYWVSKFTVTCWVLEAFCVELKYFLFRERFYFDLFVGYTLLNKWIFLSTAETLVLHESFIYDSYTFHVHVMVKALSDTMRQRQHRALKPIISFDFYWSVMAPHWAAWCSASSSYVLWQSGRHNGQNGGKTHFMHLISINFTTQSCFQPSMHVRCVLPGSNLVLIMFLPFAEYFLRCALNRQQV